MNDHSREETPCIVVAAAIICQQGKILLTRRRLDADQGGLWEFPGGKQEAGEMIEQCLRRELKEEIDVSVGMLWPFLVLCHRYPEKKVELHFFTCSLDQGTPKALGCLEMAWVSPHELRSYEFPAADQLVLQKILQGQLEQE
jgi:mutator protein MutT